MKYSKVTLSVPERKGTTIKYDFEPKSEADLLKNSEYTNWYYTVGLSAPVNATVVVYDGLFKSKTYSFSYTIKGNAMPHDAFLAILEKYKQFYTCEQMNSGNGVEQMVLSFNSDPKAYEMYQKLEGIANIGAYHGMTRTGKPALQIEYHFLQA